MDYIIGDKKITAKEAQALAEEFNTTVEELALSGGWKQVEEGKTTVPEETTPPTEPVKTTAAGDSSLADTSLGSPLTIDYGPDEFAQQGAVKATKQESALEQAKKEIDAIKFTNEELSVIDSDASSKARAKTAAQLNLPMSEITDDNKYFLEYKQEEINIAKNLLLDNKLEPIFKDLESNTLNFAESGFKGMKSLVSLFAKSKLPQYEGLIDAAEVLLMTDSEKKLKEYQLEIKKEFSDSYKESAEEIKNVNSSLNKLANIIDASDVRIDEIINKKENDPSSITQEDVDEYNLIIETRNSAVENANAKLDLLDELTESAQTSAEVADMAKRTYNTLEVASNRLESSTLRIAAGLTDVVKNIPELVNYLGNMAAVPFKVAQGTMSIDTSRTDYTPIWAKSFETETGKVADNFYKEIEDLDGKTRKRQEALKIGESGSVASDLLDFTVDLFSEQAINTGLTIGTGGAGLALISASAAGNKMHEMDIEIKEGKKISPAQYYGAAVAHGLGEYITERVSLGQAKRLFKLNKKAIDLEGLSFFSNKAIPTYAKAFGRYGLAVAGEGSAEAASQLIGNLADKYILGENIALTQGLSESFISGAFMSGVGFSSPVLATDLYNAFSIGAEMKSAQSRAKEMISLRKKIDKLQQEDSQNPETITAVSELQKQIDELAEENIQSMNLIAERVDELSRQDKRALLDLHTKAYRFRDAIDKINSNKKLSEEDRIKLMSRYEKGLNLIESQKSKILGNARFSKDKAKARALQMKLVQNKGLKFTFIDGETAKEAVEKAIEEVNKSDISEENKAKLIKELNEAAKEEGMNGVYLGAEYGMPISLVTAEGARKNTGVVGHEVSHFGLFEALLANNADVVGLAQDLAKHMLKTYKGTIISQRLQDVYNTYTSDQFTQAEIAEELMAAVRDLASHYDLNIDANKTLSGKLMSRWNKIFPNNKEITEVRTGQDVLNAILSFNSAFEKGEISGLYEKILSGEVKSRITKNENRQKTQGRMMSLSNAADRAKSRLAEMQEKGFDPGDYEVYELLQGMVSAQLSKYKAKGLQIIDEEEAISDVVARLYTQRDVNKFDGRGTLYGYLNGRIKFRILDAFKAGPVWIENFGEIDVEDLTGKAAREVAEETVEQIKEEPSKIQTVLDLSPKKEYKNLLRRRIVEPEVIKSIEEKVLKTVRLLKSRIDAKISKNVTVTPIIREIKKEMGKQADIDLKNAMGGKKDGELRKFLLRNKAAILENMSTTWLSQAMPFAVQKKVEGEWTTDWQGKKIDREAMSTDLAGRTSGAELVRRLPKVVGAISDSQFLESILQPNGNPIRGRKESLAKAIAEEISFDIIRASFEENGPIAQALIENQKRNGVENAENIGPEINRQAERGNVKFSKELKKQQLSVITEYYKIQKGDFAAQQELTDRTLDQVLSSLVTTQDENGNPIPAKRYNLVDEKEYNEYVDKVFKILIPLMPKDFWLQPKVSGKGYTQITSLLNNHKSVKALDKDTFYARKKDLIKRIEGLPNEAFGPPIKGNFGAKGLFNLKFKKSSINREIALTAENLLSDEKTIKEATENGDLLRYNRNVEIIHREMWRRFNRAIKMDKENAIVIATYLGLSTNDTSHPQRYGARIGGYSRNFKKGFITLEHSLPNVAVMQTLLTSSLVDATASDIKGYEAQFSSVYRAVKENYVLLALNESDDSKLRVYSKTMPKDWNIFEGNWWDRYFNPLVAKTEGKIAVRDENGKIKKDKNGKRIKKLDNTFGIEPKNIILPSDKSLAEVIGIDKFGRYEGQKLKDFKEKFDIEGVDNVIAKQAVIEEAFFEGQRMYSKSFPEPSILNAQFNAILRRKSGIDGATEISRARGQILGRGKGRFKFFIAPGADDFRGLVHYAFAGQGKQGEKDMEFFEKNLMDPYFRGIAAIDAMRQLIKREFKVVTKEFKDEYKMLKEPVPGTPFTYDHALRVYMWGLAGIEVPGLDKKDLNTLENAILDNPALADFAEALLIVGRREAWPKPSEFWLGDSVLADLNSMTEKVGRKDILAQFITNVDAMFDEATLNKIEAIKGRKHREALEDAIYAMKNGSNRPSGANMQTNRWLNWINGSTASIMFVNRRSALLQMLSFTNFINWSDNNPIKAAAAFANQKQYWKDFVFLFNSDKLKERRGGLKQDISESEIAQVAGQSKNSPQAVLARILKYGFLPTQIADSFAIATGGATFYRNRVNTYLKQGMSQKKAEEKAFEDFSKASDVAQQSSDPALVSQEQRSILGRLILAFANTPMQYTRLMKKAGQDLINGRGDAKTHISKILYYGAVQNFIFSALQSALFALAFDDDEEDDEKRKRNADKKLLRTVNSMVDTILRGSGIYGAVVSTIKNTIQTYYAQQDKKFMADHTYTVLSALNISPPIGSKFRKLYAAIQTAKFEKDAIAARGWALTADGKLNLGPNWAILGALTSGVANVPIDRIEAEISSIAEALDARNKAWQRIALALGWKTWDVGAKNEEEDLIETLAKEKRKEEGMEKAKETRRKNKKRREIKDASDF